MRKAIVLIVGLLLASVACAQKRLPSCVGSNKSTWTSCVGEATTPKGQKYIGEYKNGKRTGEGAYIYPHGLQYMGEFLNGSYHGNGTLTQPDGAKYVGEFRNDKRNGAGVEYRVDGSVLRAGLWSNDVFFKAEPVPSPLKGEPNLLITVERGSPSGPRVALVIGNNEYQYAKKLDNAVADAQAFRRELEARGFQVVYRENANRRAMNGAMEEFIGKLGTDAIGLVYYSGHGVQINGANYLVPTDLSAKTPSDFAYDAIDLEKLVSRVSQAQAKFSLAVIDACRDNPFQGNGRDIGGSRGLVAPSGNASGMMVVYSAGANQKALDRLSDADRNPNGLFTREFLKAMRIPGLTVQEAVNQIKTSVIAQAKSVGHVQTPAIYDQSVGTFMFTPGQAPADNIVRPNPVAVAPAMTAEQREDAFWVDAKAAGNKEAFEGYLESYPRGRYVSLARANIARLSTANVQVVSTPPVVAPITIKTQQEPIRILESGVAWAFSLGTFTNPDNVKQIQSKLESVGVKSITDVIKTKEGDKIRLLGGPFKNKSDAEKSREIVKAAGFDVGPAIVK
jgi:hypothetical protein